jgi:predicted DNA-binding transcriptional regulator AlpA
MSLNFSFEATLPKTGFVRLSTILAVIPISKSSWWAGVKSGKYPRSHKLGRCTMWRAEDIHDLIAKISGTKSKTTATDEAIDFKESVQ